MPNKKNLFNDIPDRLLDELFEELATGKSFRIERIVSAGHSSPPGCWYDQRQHEWVVLLSGAAQIEFDGDQAPLDLIPGDYILIPAGCKHRVVSTKQGDKTIWLAIHFDR